MSERARERERVLGEGMWQRAERRTWYIASPVCVERAMERKMMEEEDRA